MIDIAAASDRAGKVNSGVNTLTNQVRSAARTNMTSSCEFSLTDGESSRHPDGNPGLPNRMRIAQHDRLDCTFQYSDGAAGTCPPSATGKRMLTVGTRWVFCLGTRGHGCSKLYRDKESPEVAPDILGLGEYVTQNCINTYRT